MAMLLVLRVLPSNTDLHPGASASAQCQENCWLEQGPLTMGGRGWAHSTGWHRCEAAAS